MWLTRAASTSSHSILVEAFAESVKRPRTLTDTLGAEDRLLSTEILLGVVIRQTRPEEVGDKLLALGISPEGVEFSSTRHTSQLILLLLSPIDSQEASPKRMTEITRLERERCG